MGCMLCGKAADGPVQVWKSGQACLETALCSTCARTFLESPGHRRQPDTAVPGPAAGGGAFASGPVRGLRFGQAVLARAFRTGKKGQARLSPCPTCKASLQAILASGLASCPACYTHFQEHLEPLMRIYHGQGRPGGAHRALSGLEEALKSALEQEDYEEAGRLSRLIEGHRRGAFHGH